MSTRTTRHEPREAFFLLGKFALAEWTREWDDVGGRLAKDGIAGRLADFLGKNQREPGAGLLRRCVKYGDAFVFELTAGFTGS